MRWVAEQLGHSSPMLTLKTYAHAIREEEMDRSFADFEVHDGSERLYPAPSSSTEGEQENAPDLAAEGVHIFWSTRPGSLAGFARFALAERSSAANYSEASLPPPHVGKEMLALISLRLFG